MLAGRLCPAVDVSNDLLQAYQLEKGSCQKEKAEKTYSHHFNVNYCAACSKGGDLICCDRCPMSVHCDCVGLNGAPEGSYFCPDCTSGKSVLFGDIVWVKMGQHRFEIHIGIRLIDIGFYRFVSRWWPGRVLPPDEVPPVHLNRQLKPGEFVVYFYGCKQTAIVYRGQAFHYEDGVSSNYLTRQFSLIVIQFVYYRMKEPK